MQIPDTIACGYYRAMLPAQYCAQDLLPDIELVADYEVSLDDDYDAYIFHRVFTRDGLRLAELLQAGGKKIVWELDDDLTSLPAWNPASSNVGTRELETLHRTAERADEIWVTTVPLKARLGHPEKTKVLPNLIDVTPYCAAARKAPPYVGQPVRILWAGSHYHDGDLSILVEVVERIVDEHGEDVQLLFFGDIPTALADFVRTPGAAPRMKPKALFGRSVGFIAPTSLEDYPRTLAAIEPDICLAPLADHTFNRSKSNIKWLEYSLANAPTIATRLPPYECIGDAGILVDVGDNRGWYWALKQLIAEIEYRHDLAAMARARVMAEYSWSSPAKQIWLDAFRGLPR